ncbi:ubiquitin-conjugating enzyme and catalytic subunit of SCF ubiquitin-protein ligase complex [Nadsonia fulvescens var. elongata DSM 6958]|uniref:Ubiquitin-conjugating enzyme and catalytic subunit of SCF ubiquitin-protein ligase complex n=1 Tax=Nadsonia fulvescens var. elongata DSM 6958 TaxID=857566 RepID=A0A1E3PHT3_9ASCO|nr:ubiquitin-conjugating enzyme and catalytic subunit of SCF ubiquitin-protein ligase complex [Nadsonia fulvescens var. elongata DSM 6958]
MSNLSSASAALLFKQFRELTDPKKGVPSFHITLQNDNIYTWNVGVMVLNEDSVYHGGYFNAQMIFPLDYPFKPPQFRFVPSIFHPNVYKDGRLCISILHTSGDATTGEPDGETWSPAQSVESVLISIVSLLEDPNTDSPANVDASILWRKDRAVYNERVLKEVEDSKKNIPEDFIMPTGNSATAYVAPKNHIKEDDIVDEDFWYESADSMEEDDEEDDDDDNLSFDDEDDEMDS